MQAQYVIDQVRTTLVEPVAGFWSNNELLAWINRAEADFSSKVRITEDMDMSNTEAGINKYPLPSNCISISGIMYNDKQSSPTDNWIRLKPSSLEKYFQETPNFLAVASDQQGPPRSYMVWDRTLYLFPCPDLDGSSNLVMFFKSKPIPLTAPDQELNTDDSLVEGLIAFVLWKAWQKEQEEEKAAAQKELYKEYIGLGLRWQKKQSGDRRNRLDIASATPFEGPADIRFNPLA